LNGDFLASTGLILVFIGFLIILFAVLTAFIGGGKAKGGGVILIGPFPIVFGSDAKTARTLIYLTIALIAIMIIWFIVGSLFFSLNVEVG
jgi:uncharacterized protein (TIGR00304 family)